MKYPIRTEIEVLPADKCAKPDEQVIITSKGSIKTNPQRPLILGWSIIETIGITVINTKGISKDS